MRVFNVLVYRHIFHLQNSLDEISRKVRILDENRSDHLRSEEVSDMNAVIFSIDAADMADDLKEGMIVVFNQRTFPLSLHR